jgi:hypothetical protein
MRQSCVSLASSSVEPGYAPAEAHVVQLAAHGAQAGFDVAKTLAIGQLRKGYSQILVATGEASMVRISAIALDALLEIVGGQVIQGLGEDCLSGIHPSSSAISAIRSHLPIGAGYAGVNFKSKNESYPLRHVLCDDYGRCYDFSRTLLIRFISISTRD